MLNLILTQGTTCRLPTVILPQLDSTLWRLIYNGLSELIFSVLVIFGRIFRLVTLSACVNLILNSGRMKLIYVSAQ